MEDVELTATTTLADAMIESVAMDEGRIVNTTSGFKYEYNLQDHLYSNRVSFRPATDSTLAVSMVQNYYPFGRDMGDTTMNYSIAPNNRYKYESKEWQPGLGMDMYDFGARYYDPILATWHSIDPLAEGSAEWSGYNYVEDNPINVMDPDGMQPGVGGGFGGSQPLINDIGIPVPWANSSAASTVVGAAKGGGTNFPGILGNSVTAVNGVISTINAVNASTPGFKSLQDFSKFGSAQGNGMRVQGPGAPAQESGGGQNSGFRWPTWTYNIPVIGSAAQSGNALNKGNYLQAAIYETNALLELFSWKASFKYKIPNYTTAAPEVERIIETNGMTTVGRWMSKNEYLTMIKTGRVVEGAGGQTFVTTGGPGAYTAAAKGSIYAEFQVPTNSLLQGGKTNWLKLLGPNSGKAMQGALQKQGGQLLPFIKNLSPILGVK